jgi:clan AA aspartic protease (TIGR02281 family)
MRNHTLLLVVVFFGIIAGCVTAQQSPTPQKPARADAGSIPFKRSGQQMVVEATLNRTVKANFLVDTGAGLTMIPSATAKELGIVLHAKLPTVPIQTVANVIHVPLVVLDSVEIGGMEVRDVTVAVHDIPIFDPHLPGSPGLLGRNFLGHFRVEIDLKEGFLRLEKQ